MYPTPEHSPGENAATPPGGVAPGDAPLPAAAEPADGEQPAPEPQPRGWNVVVTMHKGAFRRGMQALSRLGRARKTPYYNVVVVEAADARALAEELARRVSVEPALFDAIAYVAPVDAAFDFATPEEFEAKARDIVAAWAPRLAGRSFHVRLHRRGFKGRLSTPKEERFLDEAILSALSAAGATGEISFDDPDAVIDVETVGARAGLALWTRDDLRSNPFLRSH